MNHAENKWMLIKNDPERLRPHISLG